jgi:hypothetical protein
MIGFRMQLVICYYNQFNYKQQLYAMVFLLVETFYV